MTVKIVVVLGFLLFLAVFYSQPVDLGGDPQRLRQVRHRAGRATATSVDNVFLALARATACRPSTSA